MVYAPFPAPKAMSIILEMPKPPWYKWFAWHPVVVGNNWVWLRNVYRQKIFFNWRYGTILDVIKG
jgi:hypothetical protein